jgi:hypothetical protein
MAEPFQQRQFSNGAQEATPYGARGVAELAANGHWDPSPAGGLGAGGVGSGGYPYGEIAKLLEWEKLQPPARCSVSGWQQSPPSLSGRSRGAAQHFNASLRSSASVPALPGEVTGQEHSLARRYPLAPYHQSSLGRGGRLPSNIADPVGNLPSGGRASVIGSVLPNAQMPQPAARSPAQILEQALSSHVPLRDAPAYAEAKNKRARIEPPWVESSKRPPAGAASDLHGGGPMVGQALDPEGAGIHGRAEQLQMGGDERGSILTGSRPPLHPNRVGLTDGGTQVGKAIPSP